MKWPNLTISLVILCALSSCKEKLSDGKMNFKLMHLPWQAQLTAYKAIVRFNANNLRSP